MRRLRPAFHRALTLARRPIVRTVLFALVGATVGVMLFGRVNAQVGPFDCTVAARPSLRGSTLLRLAPLGSIELDTHSGPVALELRVDELRPDEARRYAANPSLLEDVQDDLADDARSALEAVAIRALLVSIGGGVVGALASRVSWRSVGTGALVGFVFTAILGADMVITFRPEAVSEPRYTGLLTVAPQAVGDVEDLIERFDDYRAQLTGLVGNVVKLYRAVEGLPDLDPGDEAIRLLHVSDVHNNPQAFDLMEELIVQFDVDAVVDTGDMTDWGTAPESRLFDRIGDLDIPYIWVRGNHDSRQTQRAVREEPNAVVLDGDVTEIDGLRVFGIGDPRFTPDQTQENEQEAQEARLEAFSRDAERSLRQVEEDGDPVDVALVHDVRSAARLEGLAPLVLAGHLHRPEEGTRDGTRFLIEGSTGGAGLRSLEGEEPEPLTASILYFDPDSHRLVAYDRISVEGLGGAGVSIDRHTVANEDDTDTTTTVTEAPVAGAH